MEKRYQNICYWMISMFVLIVMIIPFKTCNNNPKPIEYINDSIWTGFHAPFLPLMVDYQDSIYDVLIRENELYIFPHLWEMKFRYKIYEVIKHPLKIDSLQWEYIIKKQNRFIMKQKSIDSIYSGNINNILLLLDTNKDGRYNFDDKERNYLIYLLFQHQIYLSTNCETGMYIIESKP